MRTIDDRGRWFKQGFGVAAAVVLACVTVPLCPVPAHAVLLYDVDFEAPLHTVDAPPTMDQGTAPRHTVTRIFFGDPVISAQSGVLDGQFLRLFSGDQVIFGIGASDGGFLEQYPYYKITADLVIQELGSGSSLNYFVDGPAAHHVRFNSSGLIEAVVGGNMAYEQPIGSFDFGTRLLLDVRIDRVLRQWWIRLDHVLVFTGDYPIHTTHGMRMLRPSIGGPGTVDFDNVRIIGLPEPTTLAIWSTALSLVLRRSST